MRWHSNANAAPNRDTVTIAQKLKKASRKPLYTSTEENDQNRVTGMTPVCINARMPMKNISAPRANGIGRSSRASVGKRRIPTTSGTTQNPRPSTQPISEAAWRIVYQ